MRTRFDAIAGAGREFALQLMRDFPIPALRLLALGKCAGRRLSALALAAALVLAPMAAHAVEPDEILTDAQLESRARKLSGELRCLVCQNQSIDDSNAPLAKDLRVLVRERLKAGDSDQAVMSYIVARYGEFVLLRPKLGLHTILLWLAPLALLIGGILVARRGFARSTSTVTADQASAALSADERRRLDALLGEQQKKSARK